MNVPHEKTPGKWTRAPRLGVMIPLLPREFDTALCAQPSAEPMLWDLHVDGETREERETRHRAAIEICSECPIRQMCGTFAEHDAFASGVWGGRVFSPKWNDLDNGKIVVQEVSCFTLS